jgi:hypothetical protein
LFHFADWEGCPCFKFKLVSLAQGQVLYDADGRIDYAYFPGVAKDVEGLMKT